MTNLSLKAVLSSTVRRPIQCAIILFCAAGSHVLADTLQAGDLAPFDVVYEVGNNLISAGTAKLSLKQQDDDTWVYSLKTQPRGVFKLAGKGHIEETSIFTIDDSAGTLALRPQTYSYRQDEERRRAVDATFDWNNKTISHVYRSQEVTEAFTDPVLDRLTVTLLIMNSLRNDFTNMALSIFDTGKIKSVDFYFDGTETLDTPLGKIETQRVINRATTGGSRETTTWFAPSLDYLPVKIEHHKRDELVARLSLLQLDNRVTTINLEVPEKVLP